MMNIIVLMKTIQLLYAQTGMDLKNNYIGPDDHVNLLNPSDELALEFALSMRDKQPETHVATLSVGGPRAEAGLRRSIAMGADTATHIRYDDPDSLDPWATASILASVCKKMEFDLILCGAGALDDNAGLVGQYVAEMMNIPHVSRVSRIDMAENGKSAQIDRAIERGDRQVLKCRLPALFSISKGSAAARYPELAGILRAEQWPIETLTIEEVGRPGGDGSIFANRTEVIQWVKPMPKRSAADTAQERLSAKDRVNNMMKLDDLKKGEGGNIVEGHSDEVFVRLDPIFRDAGILSEEPA